MAASSNAIQALSLRRISVAVWHTRLLSRINWLYLLLLLPTITEWFDDGHFPKNLRSGCTDIVMTVMTWLLVISISNKVKRIEELSLTDKLTGLLNARAFHAELERQVAFTQRMGNPLTLVFIDIDNFKPVNDRHGHPTGDLILKKLGECLPNCVRKGVDLCFRLGGDEFVVLCQKTDLNSAFEMAARILQSACQMPELLSYEITLSLGVAELAPKESAADFLKRADNAMYSAKKNGKNRVSRAAPFEI